MGWVGDGCRIAGQISSEMRAIANSNIGYAVGTTDAGGPLYQDGSLSWANCTINKEPFRYFPYRETFEQAV